LHVDQLSGAAVLAQSAAQRLDEPLFTAVSGFGTAFGLLVACGFDMAEETLTACSPGTETPEQAQLAGMLTLTELPTCM
jgi:hypothetical protein